MEEEAVGGGAGAGQIAPSQDELSVALTESNVAQSTQSSDDNRSTCAQST